MHSGIMNKISTEDLSVIVYKRMKTAITTRLFAPGERLNLPALAEQWGVSHTPIKDAIVRLSAEGLVTVKPKVGTFVTPFTKQDMLELFDVRLILETGICHEICKHITDEQIDLLEQIYERGEEELAKPPEQFDYFQFNDLDAQFHETLVGAAGNKKMLQIYKALNFHTQSARYFHNRFKEKMKSGQDQHKEVIQVLRKRDAEMLKALLTRHIQEGKEKVHEVREDEESRGE
jgi:Transcriptional regulators